MLFSFIKNYSHRNKRFHSEHFSEVMYKLLLAKCEKCMKQEFELNRNVKKYFREIIYFLSQLAIGLEVIIAIEGFAALGLCITSAVFSNKTIPGQSFASYGTCQVNQE